MLLSQWASTLVQMAPRRRGARFRAVGISDVSGARYASSGLPMTSLIAELSNGTPVDEMKFGDSLGRDALLAAQCDVLIPAAVGGVIDGQVAERSEPSRQRGSVVWEGPLEQQSASD